MSTDSNSNELPIYRMVAGERVRISQQDSNRRYGQVCDSEETYLLEFTDEEERVADAQAAQWEADAPVREAARLEAERLAEEFRSTLVYQNRVVAFLDVLGWADAVTRSASDANLAKQLGVALGNIRNHIEQNDRNREAMPPGLFHDIRISQFSDSIVISMMAEEIHRAQENLVWILRSIIWNFQDVGLFVRGGVTIGPMIHQGSLAYGPALTEAYCLEQKAVNPRIILCPRLERIWGRGTQVVDKDGEIVKEWRSDNVDGVFFFDFMSPWPSNSINNIYIYRFNQASELISKWLRESNSYRTRDKYVWLSNYLRVMSEDFPAAGLVLPRSSG